MWRRGVTTLCLLVCVGVVRHDVDGLINDQCRVDGADNDMCKINHSYCARVNDEYGLCKCVKGYTAARNERECTQVLGQTTCRFSSAECDITNSMCDVTTSRCVCKPEYMTSRDKTKCLPPLGRSCQSASECLLHVPHSQCADSVCACRDQFLAAPSQTACLPLLGKRCRSDGECAMPNSYCDNGLCACRRGERVASLNKTMCLPLVTKILEPCDEDSQCMSKELGEDTFCFNRQCACRYGNSSNTNVNGTCEKRKVLDDWCSHTQQCQMISHASCVQNKCSCDPYYVPHGPRRMSCVPIAIVYGASCLETVQCTAGFGPASRCKAGTCQCVEDHHFVVSFTGRCVPNRGLTQSCSQHSECYLPLDYVRQNVECANNSCRCKTGFEPGQGGSSCSGATTVAMRASLLALPLLMSWRG